MSDLMRLWSGMRVSTEEDAERLAVWARRASLEQVRLDAIQYLARTPGVAQARAIRLMAEKDLAFDIRSRLFDFLTRAPEIGALLRDPPQRRLLLSSALLAERQQAGEVFNFALPLLNVAERSEEVRRGLALEFLEDPAGYPRNLLRVGAGHVPPQNLLSPSARQAWLETLAQLTGPWAKAWASNAWSPAQRDAAIAGLPALSPEKDPTLRPVLRAALRDTTNGISAASRTTLLRLIAPLTLEDVRAVFDLATPEGSDGAVAVLWSQGMPAPTPSAELLEALRLSLRPDAPSASIRSLVHAHAGLLDLQRRLVEVQLAHRDPDIQSNGVADLASRESAEDLPLWLQALTLPSAGVRVLAAKGLGRLAHPDATKALVKALDDPSSKVRDAAIESLEAIQKVEDLKARWREKVR